jgi:hypothetical protein
MLRSKFKGLCPRKEAAFFVKSSALNHFHPFLKRVHLVDAPDLDQARPCTQFFAQSDGGIGMDSQKDSLRLTVPAMSQSKGS